MSGSGIHLGRSSKEETADGEALRISFPGPDTMTDDQKKVYDKVVNGPRGTMIGPLRAVIHSPELADRWQHLGEYVRYRTVLPEPLKELAILVTARRWNSQVEWTIHRPLAEKAGLPDATIEAIRCQRVPSFEDTSERDIYEFVRELQMQGQVSDSVYFAVKERWGERGIVELTAVVGYYTMVAMTLNAHRVPLPDGAEPNLGGDGGDPHPPKLSAIAPAEPPTED